MMDFDEIVRGLLEIAETGTGRELDMDLRRETCPGLVKHLLARIAEVEAERDEMAALLRRAEPHLPHGGNPRNIRDDRDGLRDDARALLERLEGGELENPKNPPTGPAADE